MRGAFDLLSEVLNGQTYVEHHLATRGVDIEEVVVDREVAGIAWPHRKCVESFVKFGQVVTTLVGLTQVHDPVAGPHRAHCTEPVVDEWLEQRDRRPGRVLVSEIRIRDHLVMTSHVSSLVVRRDMPDRKLGQPRIECRKLLCRRMNVFAAFTACSTHLDAPRSATTRNERDEALFVVNANYGGNSRIVGGDFNLPSSELSTWQSGYWDVDPLWRATYAATGPSKKIDWSFGNKGSFPSTRFTGAPECNTYYSDHCYLRGTWVLP